MILQNPYPLIPFTCVGDPTNNGIKQLKIIGNIPDLKSIDDNNTNIQTQSQRETTQAVPRVNNTTPNQRSSIDCRPRVNNNNNNNTHCCTRVPSSAIKKE